MKLLIIFSVVVCSYAAKLDRTYLPPASTGTAGGSPGSLIAPGNGPSGPVSGTPGSTGPSSGAFGFNQSPFSKSSPSAFGQQPAPSSGRPSGSSAVNQLTGPGLSQPSAPGFQTPSSQYGQPAVETGFGKISSAVDPSFGQTSADFGQAPTSIGQVSQEQTDFQRYQPDRARASLDSNADILKFDNQNDGDSFAYSFETSNGISAEESGVATNGVRAQGGFSYTDDDGQVIRVTYTADENGYQPQGDHLPTPHPIPEEILRSIEENARAAAAGTQEGAYNPDEDVSAPQQSNGDAPTFQLQGVGASQNAYSQPQGQSPAPQYGAPTVGSAGVGASQNAYNQPQGQSPAPQYGAPSVGSAGVGASQNAYNQPQGQSPAPQYGAPSVGSARVAASQNAYSQPQGQAPAPQYAAPSVGSAASRKPSSVGSSSFEGFNKPSQPGFGQNGQIASQSGYEYSQPQTGTAFGRASAPSGQPIGQYKPESLQSGQPQGPRPGSFQSANGQGFAPSGSNGQFSVGAFPGGSSFGAKPKGSNAESTPTGTGFGPTSGFGQSAVESGSQGSGQYKTSQLSGPKSSMPSTPYQYNRPSQQAGAPQQTSAQQPGFRPSSQEQGKPAQTFGTPRQPPSFTDEEGYKY